MHHNMRKKKKKKGSHLNLVDVQSLVSLLETRVILLPAILELLCYFGCRLNTSCCCSKLVFHYWTSWRYLMWNSYKKWISGTSLAVLAYETGLHSALFQHWLCSVLMRSVTQHAPCKLIQTCHATSFCWLTQKENTFHDEPVYPLSLFIFHHIL